MKSIGRRIATTRCHGQILDTNGEFSDFTAQLVGDYSAERATRALRREYKDSTITINNVEKTSTYYKMRLDEFMKAAKPTDTKEI